MNVTIRKLVVGLVALAALIGIHLLYTRSDRTTPVVADVGRALRAPVAEANAEATEHVGTVLDVGIGRVEQTRFVHRNERNEVDRIFGFEQLLHQQGNQWEITHPYMSLVFPAFRCDVTADRGRVHVEAAFARLTAGDASFSGNVILHIIPSEPNDAKECFIHLDDVSFHAAKSLFSSVGAVHFLSRSAQLTGTGMELLYDEGHNRLELFRIFDLDSLRLSSRSLGTMADLTPRRAENAAPGQGAQPRGEGVSPSGRAGILPVRKKQGQDALATKEQGQDALATKEQGQDALATAGVPQEHPEAVPDDCYQCIFHRNVAINMPDRVISARDGLAIDNILWSGSKPSDVQTRPALDPNDPNAVPHPGPNARKTADSSHPSIRSIPPEVFDIVVTCDGGFEVTPMGTAPKTQDAAPRASPVARERRESDNEGRGSQRQRAAARRIHFNALTTDTTLEGPVEMAFQLDPNGLQDAQSAAQAMPMTIAARKAVRFLAAADQVLLEGDCKVTLVRSEPNLTHEYILTAPRLILDLASQPDKAKEVTVSVRQLVTDGGPAALHILRRGAGQVLGETRLDAAQLRYEAGPVSRASGPVARDRAPGSRDTDQEAPVTSHESQVTGQGARFLAFGPGALWIRNDVALNAKADPNQFGLGRPCIARLTNFDVLTYSAATHHIIAQSEAQQLLLDYFPLADGKYNGHTRVVAGHVEAFLKEVVQGRLELASLTATQGIVYEDETIGFVGSSLSYDCDQAVVNVRGDQEQPCYLNGALVDQIDLDLKTGRIKHEVSAPGFFQGRR